jgi:hypothetical protein
MGKNDSAAKASQRNERTNGHYRIDRPLQAKSGPRQTGRRIRPIVAAVPRTDLHSVHARFWEAPVARKPRGLLVRADAAR